MGPEVNDHVSLQWPSYEQPRARTWDHRGSKSLGPKLLPLGHHLEGLRLGFFIVSRSELVFLNSNLWVKEAISMKNAKEAISMKNAIMWHIN
jgi:hypothetical protein